jgi:hypothetical protein
MRPSAEPLVDRVLSAGSEICSATQRISGAAVFISALVLFWMVAGIGTASSAPCPAGTVPAPPPLSGCLVLAPCPAGTVPAPPPLSGCLVLTACPTGQTLQNGTCQPNSSAAPTTSVCPPFQSSDASGNCVCLNGSAPGANGFCPGPNICLLGGTCCPPGGETGTGTCCPQGQIPMSDGTCVPFNSTIAKIVANEGLCPPSEELQPDGTCLYSTDTPGYGTACTVAAPIPISPYGGPLPGPSPCCLPGQLPATSGVPPSANRTGTLQYTGTCCPVGQAPQPNGSCLPQQAFISPCSTQGGGAYNAQTNSCCPPGYSISNHYTCCPPDHAPQPNGTCGCAANAQILPDGTCVPCATAAIIVQGQCVSCPNGQIGTLQNYCCTPGQVTSTGSCCPSGFHPQGAYCMPGTALSRPLDDCPPGTTRQDNGTCKMTQPVITRETPGLTTPLPALPSPPVPSRLCSAGETMLRDGDCCPSGQVTSRGTCCTPPYLPASDGTCRRPPQQRPAESDAPCGIGLLPREAFQSDRVCVTLAVHDQTIADNIAAPSRTKPDGSCVQGYVWREARASDHICVLPATRTQTWSDNRRQCGDERCTARGVPTQNTVPERAMPDTERTKLNVFRPHLSRGGATSHRWAGQRTTTHTLSGHRAVVRGSGLHAGGGGGGFRNGGFHSGGFHGGGGRRR